MPIPGSPAPKIRPAEPILPDAPVPTGWAAVDEVLGGGLIRGALHEWSGLGLTPRSDADDTARPAAEGPPPLLLLMHLAARAQAAAPTGGDPRAVLWIGDRVRPYPPTLAARWPDLLTRSVFVAPPDDASRLWAIDLALRCPSVEAVIADGTGLRMAHSRRLQLAAETGRTFALLVRPEHERHELSAAATRWHVRRAGADVQTAGEANPRFELTLTRRKGGRTASPAERTRPQAVTQASIPTAKPGSDPAWRRALATGREMFALAGSGGLRRNRWLLEWNREAAAVVELPELVDRSRAPADGAYASVR